MGILIDLVVIAIVLLNVMLGYKKGLINVIFSICAFLIALILTVVLYKPIANMIINNTEIDEKIEEIIIQNNTDSPNNETQENEENTTNLQQYIESKIQDTTNETKNQAIEIVANSISYRAIEIITGIMLFIVVRIIVIILKFFIEGIAEIPIIKQFNKAGGIVYGLLKSIIILLLLLTLMFLVISINGNGLIADAINSSYITKFLYENNIIVNYCFLNKNLL